MRKFISISLAIFLICSIGFSTDVSAYKKEGWKLPTSTQSYKWGASLKAGVHKQGWSNAIGSWKSATKNNVKINLFYHSSSVHFLTRWTEKDSRLYGKMITTKNKKGIVVKYQGYLNDYSVKNSNVAKSTAVHELGHALGIAHTTGTSIMNSERNRNKMTTPQKDDINGVKNIYK